MDGHDETLILIDHGADAERVLEALRRVAQVTQVLPPRLALAAGDTSVNVPGTTAYADDVPDTVLDELSPAERMFVSAWRTRRAGKRRPGEGLPWDAPGHLPPDLPPGSRR
ncbi:hypothetical protein [Micromonospora sp. DT47]|uniref:hypothetical protein n=1 Tax=Micromonospora sp. DT47 TaxID=3393431 RepID=UPI003CFAF8D9